MNSTLKKTVAGIALAFSVTGAANAATIFVPSFGTSGTQSFSYTFSSATSGVVTFGVSDQGDNGVNSMLQVFNPGGLLSSLSSFTLNSDPAIPVSTATFLNASGNAGTDGEIFTFQFSANTGDILSFDWIFSTVDYDPFEDFAFVSIDGPTAPVFYDVLAQIDGNAVPAPGSLALLGLGLAALGLSRKKIH